MAKGSFVKLVGLFMHIMSRLINFWPLPARAESIPRELRSKKTECPGPGFAVNQMSTPPLIGGDAPGHLGNTQAAGKCQETWCTLPCIPPPTTRACVSTRTHTHPHTQTHTEVPSQHMKYSGMERVVILTSPQVIMKKQRYIQLVFILFPSAQRHIKLENNNLLWTKL